jgi:chromosome segregation ATPase
LNKRQADDQAQVDRYRQQENLISQIEDLKLRIPFAQYRVAVQLQRAKKVEVQAAKDRAKELQARDAPMLQRVESYKARREEFERQKESRTKTFERVTKSIGEQEKEAQRFADKAGEHQNELAKIRKAKQARVKDIAEKKKKVDKEKHSLAKCEEEVAKLPPAWREEIQVSTPCCLHSTISMLRVFC